METNWLGFFSAALSGGVVVKVIEIIIESVQSKFQKNRTAKDIVDAHLDPLLKAADEIVGKTRSLAERDFSALIQPRANGNSATINPELIGLLYLYAQFWSRIEILRQESLGISIANDKRGAILKEFLACLESQRIRLVDRVHQKAIGEITTRLDDNGKLRSVGLVEFASNFSQDQAAKEWINPLMEILTNVRIKVIRQKVLVYGVVVHALVDTLDSKHHSTHERPAYPNKLSKQSRRDIRYRVFKLYLKQVKNIEKYVG